MPKKIVAIACIVISLSITMISAQSKKIKRLDESSISVTEIEENIGRLMKEARVTGLNVAIFNDSKIVYLKSFGFRDKEKNLPMDETTVVYGASFTKAVFAYFVMDLVEKGLIDLDKPISEYLSKPLPEYENYKDLANDERYKLLTMRHLLSHTTGFANFRRLEPDKKLKIHFMPGSRYAYSGEGINLAQLVVEEITKKPLQESMNSRIFERLGMNRTSMVWEEKFENKYAFGYDENEKSLGYRKRSSAQAAGTMATTLTDYAKFLETILRGRDLKTKASKELFKTNIQINSKSQFPTLSTETTDENRAVGLGYALGWGILQTPHGKAVFKEGHDDGWGNYSILFPDKKIGILLMSNSSNGEGIYKELLETLIKNTFTPWKWENYIPYNLKR